MRSVFFFFTIRNILIVVKYYPATDKANLGATENSASRNDSFPESPEGGAVTLLIADEWTLFKS